MNIKQLFLYSAMLASLCCQQSDARKSAKKATDPDAIAVNVDMPDDFGKTHFIVGYPADKIDLNRAKKETASTAGASLDLVCDGCVKHVFFSPDDNIQKVLLYLIESEKKSIRMTAYSFTDMEVAQAIMDAHDRGVAIEIIADPGCMQDKFGKVPLIKDHEIVVFVYNPDHNKNSKKSFHSSIMHNKFILFGRNVANKSIVWTGSFNWTKSAHRMNQENVVILDDKNLIEKYSKQFELLKERCKHTRAKNNAVAKKVITKQFEITLSKKGTIFEDKEARV